MRFYSDNPVRDADRYCTYLERTYVATCWFCDLPIEGEIYETPSGFEVCEHCYNKHYADDEE